MEYTYNSPVGRLLITYTDSHVTGLCFDKEQTAAHVQNTAIAQCIKELDEYFAGTRTAFDVPVRPHGTAFQMTTWDALTRIPYGTVVSYGHIAREIGKPKASRAVGGANNKNPISIIVPCHRVVGAGGKMVGYGGGLWRKEWLLEHEAPILQIKA